MSFAIQKVENVIGAEQITVTSSPAFLNALLTDVYPYDLQQVLLCNDGANTIYVNFSVAPPAANVKTGGTTNVSSTEYIYALPAGAMMPFWMGRGAMNQCNLVSPNGNCLAMVVIGA